MKPTTLDILCNPKTRDPFQLASEQRADGTSDQVLLDIRSGERFMIRDDIPIFLGETEVSGLNRKYQRLYDRIAPFYDITTRLYALFKSGGEKKRRLEYLQELEIKDGDRVLETSIGTGANLRFLPRKASYYGVDISWGMMKRCRHKARKWNLDVELFMCAAEALCFRNEVFDTVFHMGGINYFNDKARAINEMIRVAKPGTKIIIVDETEEVAKKLEKTPGAATFYKDRPETISAPVDLLPAGMADVKVKVIGGGDLYCLSFRKP
jgi:ubiquinone/menaquinone biosynthesis C-methylase UbiE